MEAPTHLKHKPIVSVNDYDQIDGHYANKTDAMALSIGIAQYDEDEISAKVWRKPNNWSRQSEELPLHRVIELAELIVNFMLIVNGQIVNAKTTCSFNNDKQKLEEFFHKNKQFLEPKLRDLIDALNRLAL